MESGKRHTILSSYSFWAGSSVVASASLVKLAPQYSLRQNYTWTAAALFLLQWLIYSIYAVFIYPWYISPLRRLPTITENNSLLFGQWFTLVKEPSGIPMRKWINSIPNEGLIRYLHLFNRERLLITSPKALAEVLNTKNYDFHKPSMLRSGIGRVLGIGVLLAEGDDHKLQRKKLAPAFNFRHIKDLYPIFWSKSREMVETMKRDSLDQSSTGSLEIGDWASRATLDIIGTGGLGQDFNALADPNTELNNVYRKVFSPSRAAQILGLLQFFIPVWIIQSLPVKRNEDVAAAAKVARDTSRQLVRQKREKLDRKEKMDPDIISIALEAGTFTEDQLVDNMMTFLAAGHETTASAMTWAAYLLSKHPDVQAKLREEIHEHIPKGLDSQVDDTVIDNMPYLHAVCQEVLRVYAPVPLTLRVAVADTSIQGQFVPKGTIVILCPWAINYSKELWGDDVEEFKPDRWMQPGQANSGGAESNYAFMTFLHGPRSCIGSRFATAELACLLAAFVGRYEFQMTDPDEKIEIKGGITARPRNGMRLNVKAVDGW